MPYKEYKVISTRKSLFVLTESRLKSSFRKSLQNLFNYKIEIRLELEPHVEPSSYYTKCYE